MPMSRTLLAQIEDFLAEHPMSDDTFGKRAARNGRLIERLRSGGRVWPEKEVEILAFIRSYKSNRKAA